MKTKLRTTYLVTVLFFLFVTVGSMILFYNMFSEEFIIANNKDTMDNLFETIQEMNLAQLTKEEKNVLKDYTDKGGFVTIMDGEKIIYQSKLYSKRRREGRVDYNLYEYTYNAQAQVNVERTVIKLKGKIDQNVKTYYVYMDTRLKSLENSINLISKFMLVEMIIILILRMMD